MAVGLTVSRSPRRHAGSSRPCPGRLRSRSARSWHPDAAAATAALCQVRLPHRIVVILEGESLLNDASALLVYRLAVRAAVGGVTAWTVPLLALACLGGVALGVVLARAYLAVAARVADEVASVVLQFLGTFGVWLLADALGVSAVLTMVAYAIMLARLAPGRKGVRQRRESYAVWEVAVFVPSVPAFILVGLQLRGILARWMGGSGATSGSQERFWPPPSWSASRG